MSDDQTFTAYQIHDRVTIHLRAAPLERDWMDSAHLRHPYRCLPLNIANQNGWVLTCPTTFRVYWYGGPNPTDLEVRFDGPPDSCISSHFGSGVLTFSIPYLFRTPPGLNLWVKGPANWIRDAVQPLEGVVEADWAASTFTMNWKVTRPFEWVEFKADEPICMLVPIPRGLAETLVPRTARLESNPELNERYHQWEASRRGFLQGLKTLDPEAVKRGWQKDYFQGKTAEGGTFAGHQTRLNVKEFASEAEEKT
jgi:hypothetical protein